MIESGLKTFWQVGEALARVRDGGLYVETHGTFEDYCRERWQISKRHANRLIEAFDVVESVGPMGPVPETERVARPLAPLSNDERVTAWQAAIADSPEGKPTAKQVAAQVEIVKAGKADSVSSAEATAAMRLSRDAESSTSVPQAAGTWVTTPVA